MRPDVKVVVLGEISYIGVDDKTAADLGGKHWMKVDPKSAAEMDKSAKSSDDQVGAIAMMLQVINPVLDLTVAAQSGKPTRVGTEQVDGVDTVHYKAAVDNDAMVNAMTSLSADDKKKVHDQLAKDGTTNTFDFWINSKNELVQQADGNLALGKGTAAAAAAAKSDDKVKFTDLGKATPPQAPPAADTADMAELLKLMPGAGH